MLNFRSRSVRFVSFALVGFLLLATPRPAHAVNKDMVELQTEMLQLLDMVQRLQSTIDTRLGVVQHLAEQTADNANRMAATVDTLQHKLSTQNDTVSGKIDSTSGQVQSLNDSVDELKSRIAKLDKTIQDLQAQLQAMQSGSVPAAGTSAPSSTPAMNPAPAPLPAPMAPAPSAANTAPTPSAANVPPPAAQAPPLHETYLAGERDFNAAKYDVAAGEFMDIIRFYPLDDMAGNAHFYLGEIAYHQQSFSDAVKSYNAVLEGFSGSTKAPTAQLHKGFSLLQMNKKDAGIHELRLLIQRHPQTPEAAQARQKLTQLGVHVTPGVK